MKSGQFLGKFVTLVARSVKNEIEQFKIANNLDKGNIFIEIHPELDDIGGMKDGDGNRIPDIGFLTEIKFILAENY